MQSSLRLLLPSRVVLTLLAGSVVATGCESWPTASADLCLHSEGCGSGGGGGNWPSGDLARIRLTGTVTSTGTGERLAGVAVEVAMPARDASERAMTDSTGHYATSGLLVLHPEDCEGLTVTFSRAGSDTLLVTEVPGLVCKNGTYTLDAKLVP